MMVVDVRRGLRVDRRQGSGRTLATSCCGSTWSVVVINGVSNDKVQDLLLVGVAKLW